MSSPNHPILKILGNRSYLSLYLAAFISSTGSSVTTITLSWIVYGQTHSALDVSYLAISSIIPFLTLGMFSGVIADRFRRKRIMIIADVMRATAIAALIMYLFLFGFSLPVLMATVAVVSSFSSLFTPSSNAIIPQIVPEDSYESANGLLAASNQGAQMIGSALGGVIIAVSGAILGLVYNSITYLISASFLSFVIVRLSSGKTGALENMKKSVFTDLREGLGYMRNNIPILETSLGFLPGNFFYTMVITYLVAYSYIFFNANPSSYGYMLASMAAGVGIGSIIVTKLKAGGFAGKAMAYSVVGQGAAVLGLFLFHTLFIDIAFAFVMGLGVGLINTIYFSAVQSIVPNEILGRVLGIDVVGSFAAIPLGQIVGGLVTDTYGILTTLLIAAIGLLANGVLLFSLSGIRHLTYGKKQAA